MRHRRKCLFMARSGTQRLILGHCIRPEALRRFRGTWKMRSQMEQHFLTKFPSRKPRAPIPPPPKILVNCGLEITRFGNEETFDPLAPLVPFDSEEGVLKLENTYESGLASYSYTENISRLRRVAEALDTCMIGVRVGLVSACEQPFGGIKESERDRSSALKTTLMWRASW
ncbi:Aldehyde/histidinol dehydrogenase [Trichoderma barbatum]